MEDKKKMIKETLEKVEVPDSLLPENMEKKLDEADQKTAGKRMNYRRVKTLAMVASFALVLFVGIGVQKIKIANETFDSAASVETALESTDGASVSIENEETYGIEGILHSAEDYDEITDAIKKAGKEYEKNQTINGMKEFFLGNGKYETAVTEDAVEESASEAKTSGAYSDTNVRTEGVDEGDIVKTDGDYIYQCISANRIRIVKLNYGSMEQICTLSPDDEGSGYIREMYLDGNRLILICDSTQTEMKNGKKGLLDYSYTETTQSVCVITYDISDKSSPKKKGVVSVDGTYRSSRYKDGYVYLMTTYGEPIYYYCYDKKYEDIAAEDVIPKVNGDYITAEDILLPEEMNNEPFFVITSVDIKKPLEVKDTKAVMGYVNDMYVSGDSLFFYTQDYSSGYDQTTIVKFVYKNGNILPKAATTVNGTIDDSFSIDENDEGYLRVATTFWNENWELESSLYVFDKNLKRTGCIENFADNEGVKSCRFLGDIGFVVTFRNTDPLFALDLSDPYDPKIISELTLPGFSEYLHSWSGDLLLGMGFDADEDTGRVGEVKLSMFDVSDLKETKEITTKILDVDGADILDGDYKSLFISPKKGFLGFRCYDWGDEENDWNTEGYYKVFSYSKEDEAFEERLSVSMDCAYDSSVRGLYAGDYFYLVNGKTITAYDLDTFKEVSELD